MFNLRLRSRSPARSLRSDGSPESEQKQEEPASAATRMRAGWIMQLAFSLRSLPLVRKQGVTSFRRLGRGGFRMESSAQTDIPLLIPIFGTALRHPPEAALEGVVCLSFNQGGLPSFSPPSLPFSASPFFPASSNQILSFVVGRSVRRMGKAREQRPRMC